MAKFCGKCGSKLDEATGLCPKCDADQLKIISAEDASPKAMPTQSKAPSGKKATRKQKKAAKKAKKEEAHAQWSTGKKIRRVFLKLAAIVLVFALFAVSVAGLLVHFKIVDIPFVTSFMNQLGLPSQGQGAEEPLEFNRLEGQFTRIKVLDGESAIYAAKEAARKLNLSGAAEELSVASVSTSDSCVFYRLQQNYHGVPVYGRTMVVIAQTDGTVQAFSSNAVELTDQLDDYAPLSQETLTERVKGYCVDSGLIDSADTVQINVPADENLVIYTIQHPPCYAYHLQVFFNNSPISFNSALVDANTGEVIVMDSSIYESSVECYDAGRQTMVRGNYDESQKVYQLYDVENGIMIYSYNKTNSDTGNARQTFITSTNEIFGDTSDERALEAAKGVRLLYNTSKVRTYYREYCKENGYDLNFFYYNDDYDDGKNALGGTATSSTDGKTVGYLSMGSVTGVDCLDVIAHEYTHIISRRNVAWARVNTDSGATDEPGAINEAYSDIFGELIESYIKGAPADWTNDYRVIHNPMSTGYPAAVGDKPYAQYTTTSGKTGWFMPTTGTSLTDYSHGFSTIVSHCAYLMSTGINGRESALSNNELSSLWYNTMLSLPSNCTFIILRENMEMTAEYLGFSESRKNCISAAFDCVGIRRQSEEETVNTDFGLSVYDRNGNLYCNYTVKITGKEYSGWFKWGWFKRNYQQELQVNSPEEVRISLPKGDYTIVVTDRASATLSKDIKARPNSETTQIALSSTFGDHDFIPVPEHIPSNERNIVLVLDVSGSMSGTPIEETKKASINFIETILEEDASIGIVTYDNSASRVSDFSVDKSSLENIVSGIYDGGGTNIEAGLREAHSMLSSSNAKKKIIVLMSDGEPNEGKEGDDLVSYADEIKKDDVLIYTLGFFESLGGYKSSAQQLMERIASDGCHYEVANADDLVFFFEDMADQINGQKYIYVRIACPVDVSVTYEGETLSSAEKDLNLRTDFGTLTFEQDEEDLANGIDDRVKVLRLKEGTDYDLKIVGTGHGIMDYTIGFMDDNGDYSDLRRFENVKITKRTVIDTEAAVSKQSTLNIDEDGDGKYDVRLRAGENGYGEEIVQSWFAYFAVGGCGLLCLLLVVIIVRKVQKRRKRR